MVQSFIIGIAGASGAGKSQLALGLQKRIGELGHSTPVIIHEDAYYRRNDHLSMSQREAINYDHPDAIEHELLAAQLGILRAGDSIDSPVYDYAVHTRASETTLIKPTRILIVEGILILHRPELRDLLDLKVFVDVPLDVCFGRRMIRDIRERERSPDSVMEQYQRTVRPMFLKYVEPSRQFADIIVPQGGENQVALEVMAHHVTQLKE